MLPPRSTAEIIPTPKIAGQVRQPALPQNLPCCDRRERPAKGQGGAFAQRRIDEVADGSRSVLDAVGKRKIAPASPRSRDSRNKRTSHPRDEGLRDIEVALIAGKAVQ